MIFGKTWAEQFSPQWVFAWKPIKLHDGRWVWLQKVWARYPDPGDPIPYPYRRRYFLTPPDLIPSEPKTDVQR